MAFHGYHLVPKRQAAEELPERSRFGNLALAAVVARMDQHVTAGNADLPVQAVSVAEKNQTHGQVSCGESVSGRIDCTDALVDHTSVASRSRILSGCTFTVMVFNAVSQQ